MDNKDIIIHLITRELKHNRFIIGLRDLGLEPQDFSIDLLDAILPLMGLPPYKGDVVPTISDQLADTYYRFLDRVKDYPVDVLTRDLKPLAVARVGVKKEE